MNVLVTGASGQLGSEIQNNTHRISNYYFSDADSLDITDAQAIRAFVQHNEPLIDGELPNADAFESFPS